jgi:hypothetical protein
MIAIPTNPGASAADEAAMLERNGITRTTIHQYHVDGFRYSSAGEAMAQVKRSARSRAAD